MGFMEGFASGFANTFNAMETRRQANKQDAFKVAYDSYLRKQAKYDEDSKLDKGYIDGAKAIIQQVPGAPPEAWEHAYELLKTGMSPENAIKQLTRTSFAVTAQPAMSEQPVDLMGGVDPTKAAGLTLDNTANAAAGDMSAKTNPDLMGSIFGADGILNPEANKRRQLEGANKAVMNSTGMSQEEFDKVNGGYQPYTPTGNVDVVGVSAEKADPTAFKWSEAPVAILMDGQAVPVMPLGDGMYQGADGSTLTKEQVRSVTTQDMYKTYIAQGNQLDEQTKGYRTKKAASTAFTKGIIELNQMVQDNPNTIAKASIISTFVNDMGNELTSIIDQVNAGGSVEEAESNIVNYIASGLKNTDENAMATQLVVSKATSLAFTMARAQNDGRVTEEDFKKAFSQIMASPDKEIFQANAKRLVRDQAQAVDAEAGTIGPFARQSAKSLGFDAESAIGGSFIEGLDKASRDWLEAQPVVKPGNKKTDEPEKRKTSEGVITEGMAAANPKFKDHVGKAFVIYDDGTMEIE